MTETSSDEIYETIARLSIELRNKILSGAQGEYTKRKMIALTSLGLFADAMVMHGFTQDEADSKCSELIDLLTHEGIGKNVKG